MAEVKKQIAIFCLISLTVLVTSCRSAPKYTTGSGSNLLSGQGSIREKTKSLFEDSKNIDPIEGGWSFTDGNYDVAIIKSDAIENANHDYVGVLISASSRRGNWKPGEIKLELTKTSVPTIFTGTYRMGYKNSVGATFFLKSSNLLEIDLPARNQLAIRTFPVDINSNTGQNTNMASGTGFFISANGHILTAYHVVEDAAEITITTSDGVDHEARIISFSKANDLALLETQALGSTYLPLKKTSGLNLGSDIFTMGFPATEILGKEIKYSDGSIASLSGLGGEQSLLQITVPIQAGNSGGPVVTEDGFVVGVITSTAAIMPFIRSTGSLPQNVNWAVKSDYAMLLHQQEKALPAVSKQEAIKRTKAATCQITTKSK